MTHIRLHLQRVSKIMSNSSVPARVRMSALAFFKERDSREISVGYVFSSWKYTEDRSYPGEVISELLQENQPFLVPKRGSRLSLIPALHLHLDVMIKERPNDRCVIVILLPSSSVRAIPDEYVQLLKARRCILHYGIDMDKVSNSKTNLGNVAFGQNVTVNLIPGSLPFKYSLEPGSPQNIRRHLKTGSKKVLVDVMASGGLVFNYRRLQPVDNTLILLPWRSLYIIAETIAYSSLGRMTLTKTPACACEQSKPVVSLEGSAVVPSEFCWRFCQGTLCHIL